MLLAASKGQIQTLETPYPVLVHIGQHMSKQTLYENFDKQIHSFKRTGNTVSVLCLKKTAEYRAKIWFTSLQVGSVAIHFKRVWMGGGGGLVFTIH